MTSTNLIFMGDELKEIAKVTLKKRKFRVPYQDFMLEHGHITQEEYDEGQRTPCFTLVKDHGIYVMSGAANDKELWNKEEKKFKVTTGKKDMSVEDLEGEYAAALAEVQKRKDEGATDRDINFANKKADVIKSTLDMKKAKMGLGSEEDAAIGKMLKESGYGKGKSSFSATTEYTIVEPIKQDKDLSLLDDTNARVDKIVQSTTNAGNIDQNQGVIVPKNTSQVSDAAIKLAKSDVKFVQLTSNPYISISPTSRGLPPQVLRRLT